MALVYCPECGKTVSSHADQCPHCGVKGDFSRLRPKSNTFGWVLAVLVLIAGIYTYSITFAPVKRRQAEAEAAAWKAATKPHTVTYRVEGDLGQQAAVTYTNPQGGTEQSDITFAAPSEASTSPDASTSSSSSLGEWKKSVIRYAGDTVVISAQNTGNGGAVFVTILVDGEEVRNSQSDGQSVIASSDYTLP